MTAHTNFRKGTPVHVHLMNGDQFEDKFVEHRSKAVILADRGRVLIADIRAMSIRKLKAR